ncbi:MULTISPECIES: RAxF-45 family protein [Oceanobacillus]|nr:MULTISPECIES: RAxF-45 family protein [Oceanobacillus]
MEFAGSGVVKLREYLCIRYAIFAAFLFNGISLSFFRTIEQ